MSEEPAKYYAEPKASEDQEQQKARALEMARLMSEKFDAIVATHASLVCKAEGISPIGLCLCQQQGEDGVIRWWFEKKAAKTA